MSVAEAKTAEFVMSRVLNAPREMVWKCFTDPEHMKRWWGPKGAVVIASRMDLRPGGIYLYGLQMPDGTPVWGKMCYLEVTPPERIVFINSFSDEAGGTNRHPMAPSWPLEWHSTFTFEDTPDGKTKFTVRWTPHTAAAEERKAFDEGHDSMRQGWGGTLDKLEDYLAKAQ